MSADVQAAQRAVHEALAGFLEDNELVVAWCVSIDVTGPDGKRYLAHRAGGGGDGTDAPTAWTALGMLRAFVLSAEEQLSDGRFTPGEEEDE